MNEKIVQEIIEISETIRNKQKTIQDLEDYVKANLQGNSYVQSVLRDAVRERVESINKGIEKHKERLEEIKRQ
jgi:hypothetical protein